MYDRAALLASVRLEALADELLGPHHGSERSPTWPCPNPNHAQTGRTPPLGIYTTRKGEQRWGCFGCGTGGSAIDLVLAVHGGSVRSAFDFLAARAGRRPDETVPRPPHRPPRRRLCARDPEGLARYVRECAATLWTPAGAPILRWLTEVRGLPEGVLRANEIGADTGARSQFRPDGMPRAAGAVLPTIVDGQPIYAHIRVLHPGPDRPRYLNPAYDLAPSPRMCRYEPVHRLHDEIVITEGAIDGLSAAAAGYVAVPFFGTGCPDAAHALALARLPGPLVTAFDPEEGKGQRSAAHLRNLLAAHQRTAVNVLPPGGDLNEWMAACGDWPEQLEAAIADARRLESAGRTLAR